MGVWWAGCPAPGARTAVAADGGGNAAATAGRGGDCAAGFGVGCAVFAVERGDDGVDDDLEAGGGDGGDVFDDAAGVVGWDVGEQVGHGVDGGDAKFDAVGPVGVAVDEVVEPVVDDGFQQRPGPVGEPFPQRGEPTGLVGQVGRVTSVGQHGREQRDATVGVQQLPGPFGGGDAGRVGVVAGGDAVPGGAGQRGERGHVVGR